MPGSLGYLGGSPSGFYSYKKLVGMFGIPFQTPPSRCFVSLLTWLSLRFYWPVRASSGANIMMGRLFWNQALCWDLLMMMLEVV